MVVDPAHRRIFQQLVDAFPTYEVWERHWDYGAWLDAAVVDPDALDLCVVVSLAKGAGTRRTIPLTEDDIAAFRADLEVARRDGGAAA